MKIHTLILTVLVTATVVTTDAQAPQSLSIRFIGNEAFAITDGRTTLVSDFPYESGYSRYMNYDWNTARPSGDVISLITHRHRDHFASELFLQTGWRIIGPPEVTRTLPQARVVGLTSPIEVSGMRITPIPTPHANIEHYSYLVEWHGRRMFFVGDTENPDALLAQRSLDVAFVTPWLHASVQRRKANIDAAKIVIYHHQAGESAPQCARCVMPAQNSIFTVPARP